MKNRKEQRRLRHQRLRQRIKGTAVRPRMAICLSNRNIIVQFIDDDAMATLAAVSTLGNKAPVNCEAARALGVQAAEAAQAKGISLVVVDRGGFRYHGRIRELVEAAVANGLKVTEKAVETEESK